MKNFGSLLVILLFISFSTNLSAQQDEPIEVIIESIVEIGETADGVHKAQALDLTEVYAAPGGGFTTSSSNACRWSTAAEAIPCSGGKCKLVVIGTDLCLICVGSDDPGSNIPACHSQVQ